MQRKYLSRLWKYFFAAAVLLYSVGCGRQGAPIPSVNSEGSGAESPEGSGQAEMQKENKEQSAEQHPDDAGLPIDQPEQEAALSRERTTAAFDAGSFFELNLAMGGDCVYGFGRRKKGEKTILFQVGAEDGTVRDFEEELEYICREAGHGG